MKRIKTHEQISRNKTLKNFGNLPKIGKIAETEFRVYISYVQESGNHASSLGETENFRILASIN